MELRNLWSSLFGSGKTDIKKEPIITEAAPSTDSTTESPQPALSIEKEIQVLAHHFGGISTGMRIEIELRELLDLCPRKRKKADSYYQLKKHLMDDYGVELIITSRTSKRNDENN